MPDFKDFTVPTLQEVRQYTQDRHLTVDPVRFFDYYSARNWTANGQKIRNWRTLLERADTNNRRERKTSRPAYLTQISDAINAPQDEDERQTLIKEIEFLKTQMKG